MKTIKIILCFYLTITICACSNTTSIKNNSETVAIEQNIVEDTGVVFQDITLEKAFEKAMIEGKYVFVNFHTKRCVPCRKMENTVFTTKKCGKYINSGFVPIMIDGEDEGKGTELANKYNIFIFPTYLILNHKGSKVCEIGGAVFNVDEFINMLDELIKRY